MDKYHKDLICPVCKKPKGRAYNHEACAKVIQEEHKHDRRRVKRGKVNKESMEYILKRFGKDNDEKS